MYVMGHPLRTCSGLFVLLLKRLSIHVPRCLRAGLAQGWLRVAFEAMKDYFIVD